MKLSSLDLLYVWHALGGSPLRGNRGQAFWRGGDGYNIALEPSTSTWYDHRDQRGGGVLDLVEVALSFNRSAALRWLQGNCGLDPRQPLSVGERQTWARRRQHAETDAERVQSWRDGLLRDLEKTKLATCQEYFTHPAQSTQMAWEYACSRLHNAEQLHGGELLEAYRYATEQNANKVERLIEATHEDQRGAELQTALIVALMGVSAMNKGEVA